ERKPVAGRVHPRHHERAAGTQHALKLAQHPDTIVDVFVRERAEHEIEARVVDPADRTPEIVHAELTAGYALARDLDHARADVEPDDRGAAPHEFLGVQAR